MEELGPDQRMQQLLQQADIGSFTALCPSNNKATLICVNLACKKSSLHCQDCQKCEGHLQSNCAVIQVKYLTMIINKQRQCKKKLIASMVDIQSKMMEKLHQNKERLLGIDGFTYFERKEIEFLRYLYGKQKKQAKIFGEDAAKIVKKVQIANSDLINIQEETINKYKEKLEELTQNIIRLQNNAFETSQVLKQCQLDSKICPKGDQNISFIFKSLNFPLKHLKLQLLFRASEHNFLASQFHKKCDNIQSTLVLISTEFGKIIAGYTPLRWNSHPKGEYLLDLSGRSFLLAVNARQKLKLNNNQKAIYCYSDFGPTFGAGCDIYISDQCNQNNSSYSECYCTYNCDMQQQERSQQSYQIFSGATNGSNYRVMEYEVFKVVQFD